MNYSLKSFQIVFIIDNQSNNRLFSILNRFIGYFSKGIDKIDFGESENHDPLSLGSIL